MALKALIAKKSLDQLRKQTQGFEARELAQVEKTEALKLRETEAAKAIEEITDESTDEERSVIESEVAEIEEANKLLAEENDLLQEEKSALLRKIEELEADLKAEEERGVKVREKEKSMKVAPDIEERAIKFAAENRMAIPAEETRSVLLSTGSLAKPTSVDGIADPFNVVPSIVDLVQIDDLTGVGTHKEAYIKSWQSAGAATEGTASDPSDPTFRVAQINPFAIDTLTYVSKNLAKQTPLQYEQKVRQGALIALRKKVAAYIIGGNGSTQPHGIYNAKNTETVPESIVEFMKVKAATIDDKTLRNIVFNYGGDENIGVGARLFLNKKDLIKFGDVRGTNEKKPVYEIIPDGANPNTGIIKDGGLSVPYSICSDVTALTESTYVDTDIPTMIYGAPMHYKLGLFGNYEVNVSSDYKFAEGLLAIRGEAMIGGNVVVDKGFLVVALTSAT